MKTDKEQETAILTEELIQKLWSKMGDVMKYAHVCQCDDGFFCEHRRQWLNDFLKGNLQLLEKGQSK